MLSGIILYQTTSADTVWYQSVTSHCCPVTAEAVWLRSYANQREAERQD